MAGLIAQQGKPVPVDLAVAGILDRVEPLRARPFPIEDAYGLVLAEDLIAREDHPPFDNSAMDGFAVRSQDLFNAPVALEIIEEIAAGAWPQKKLGPGQAALIMTGAPMPEGADSVIMVEETRSTANSQVEMLSRVQPGENLRRRGEHVASGQMVLARGRVLTPAAIAMAAYLGYPRPLCHPAPSVAVVSSGDELTEPEGGDWPIGRGQIRNSNAYGLEAKLKALGCRVSRQPRVPDDPEQIARVLRRQLEENDVLVTSAGVSMGEKDYVLRVLHDLGAELVFWKVAMRPGRPLGFGMWQGKPIFALPGNPVSSLVTFEIFCRPALLKMMGHTRVAPPLRTALCGETISKKADLRLYYRCRTRQVDGQTWATPTGPQDSHLLNSLVDADALMILPEGKSVVEKGEMVQLLIA